MTTITASNLAGPGSQRPVAAVLRAKVRRLVDRVKLAFRPDTHSSVLAEVSVRTTRDRRGVLPPRIRGE